MVRTEKQLEWARQYRLRQYAKYAAMPPIPCECGCGEVIPPLTKLGTPAHFKKGHHRRGKRFPRKPGYTSWSATHRGDPRLGSGKRGKKLSPEEIAKRTATRREKNDGSYAAPGMSMTERRDPELWHKRLVETHTSETLSGERNPFYGKTHTPEARAKMGRQLEEHSKWKGGDGYAPYSATFNRKFKALIRERDQQTCRRCGRTRAEVGRTLHVHHVDLSKTNNDPENLTTLCAKCHRVVHPQY